MVTVSEEGGKGKCLGQLLVSSWALWECHLWEKGTQKTKMNKTNLLIQVQDHRWLQPIAAVQGTGQEPTTDRIPFHHRLCSYTHSLRPGQFRHIN